MTTDIDSLLAQRQWVKELALRLVGDSHVADDLSQETFLRALRSDARPSEIRSERAWLGTLLRNLVLERFRSDKRRRAREAAVEAQSFVPSTDEVVARASVHRQVVENVMDLPPKYREVLLLRYFEGHSPSEIAEARGEPISSIKTRLQRGLELMRGRLDASNGGDGKSWIAALAPVLASTTELAPPLDAPIAGSKPLLLAAAVLTISLSVGWLILRDTSPSSIAGRGVAGGSSTASHRVASDTENPRRPVGRSDELMRLRTNAVLNLPELTEPLAGIVLDIEGSPVAGVVVALRPPDWLDAQANGTAIAVSDHDGRFVFRGAEAGMIEVLGNQQTAILLGDAYKALEPGMHARPRYTIVVSPSQTLQGRVVANTSGLPLASAQIEWLGPDGLRARIGHELNHSSSRRFLANSSADGRFEITVPAGVKGSQLRVSREGFDTVTLEIYAQSREFRLARAHPIDGLTGRVVDEHERPLKDIRVGDGVFMTRTDQEGRFTLPANENRTFVLAARPGMQPARVDRNTDHDWPTDLVLRLTKPSLHLRGIVVDAKRNPVPGARVWVDNPLRLRPRSPSPLDGRVESRRVGLCVEEVNEPGNGVLLENYLAGHSESRFSPVKSDAEGRFEITGLANRAYIIAAVAPSRGAVTRQKNVRPGQADQELRLIVRPEQIRQIQGVAKAARDGQALPHIIVRWERMLFKAEGVTGRLDIGEPVRTDSMGRFELIDVPDEPGVFLRVEGENLLTQSFPIDQPTMDLAIVRRVRMRIHSTHTEGVVAFSARDRHGSILLMQAFEGRHLITKRQIQLSNGRSAWIALPDTAVEITGLDINGKILVRRPIRPEPGSSLEAEL